MVARNCGWSSTVLASSSAAAKGSSLLILTIFAFIDLVDELEWIWIVLPADTFFPLPVPVLATADYLTPLAAVVTTELLVVL